METYYTDDATRKTYSYDEQPPELFELLISKFPWVKKEDYLAISEPTFHKILQEDVITCLIPKAATVTYFGEKVSAASRKFCMTSITSFLRSYELADKNPDWMPDFCNVLFKGTNHAEYGRPFPPIAATFEDYYFKGPPDQIEAYFNLPELRGKYETGYAATTIDNKVVRVKQYIYDEADAFSDWDVIYFTENKKLNQPI